MEREGCLSLWLRCFGRTAPRHASVPFMRKMLAHEVQVARLGGLSTSLRKAIDRLLKDDPARQKRRARRGTGSAGSVSGIEGDRDEEPVATADLTALVQKTVANSGAALPIDGSRTLLEPVEREPDLPSTKPLAPKQKLFALTPILAAPTPILSADTALEPYPAAGSVASSIPSGPFAAPASAGAGESATVGAARPDTLSSRLPDQKPPRPAPKPLPPSPKPPRPAQVLLRPGTHLVREWNGRVYQVEVLEDGFRMDGKVYRSLSALARTITGTRWSGPRFFGLG